MNYKDLEPKAVFSWFYELSQIPRGSGNEKAVSDFLVKFAKERNLEVYQDDNLNIIIKKPATAGYENSSPVIIQGHMDMVCEKADDSDHDFMKDPIELVVDGDRVRANKTTLGADDGIAVAMGLAVIDDENAVHPPLELVITTEEETGMDGAMGLKADHIAGKTMLNIDSEEEGVFLVSCSGGTNMDAKIKAEKEKADGDGLRIEIRGLKGGHSGMEIIKQRANSLKLMTRILLAIEEKMNLRLAHFEGGSKHNAIPNFANCEILVDDKKLAGEIIQEMAETLKNEFAVEEPNISVKVLDSKVESVYKKESTQALLDFLMLSPEGVLAMSKSIKGLVETSINLAILEETEEGFHINWSIRSSVASSIKRVMKELQIIAKRVGAEINDSSAYPGWEYEKDSRVRELAKEVYQKMFGKEAEISAIHAGLECGLLKKILPDTDMISFGPNISGAHSPVESMEIASVERVYRFLKELLIALK